MNSILKKLKEDYPGLTGTQFPCHVKPLVRQQQNCLRKFDIFQAGLILTTVRISQWFLGFNEQWGLLETSWR